MVDRSNLQQVNMLYGEASAIDAALQGFGNGGTIIAFEVSGGPPPPEQEGAPRMPQFGVRVSAEGMATPPQMTDSIKQLLQQRKTAIDQQLRSLGLTDEPARAQPRR